MVDVLAKLYDQLNCLVGHLIFSSDPVEKKEIIREIRWVRNQLNKEDEIKQKISQIYLNNVNNQDPSQYF